jgi:hypothetical protein
MSLDNLMILLMVVLVVAVVLGVAITGMYRLNKAVDDGR